MERKPNRPLAYGNWKVLNDGSLHHSEQDYMIPADRLNEQDWIPHLSTKGWMDGKWNEFVPAYVKAMELSGISPIRTPTPQELGIASS